jgi:hypothetical protein
MTRGGFSRGTYVRINPGDIRNFPVTKEGLWLPFARLAIKEFEIARAQINRSRLPDSMARVAFRDIECDGNTGCWISGSLDEADHTAALWEIAERDMGGVPLNPVETKDDLRVCDNPECLNVRHYDITHGVAYRDKLLIPDYEMYMTDPSNGQITCAWEEGTGVILPSVEESVALLRKIQRQCIPYINDPSEGVLTPSGVSKLTIDPITGCMPVRTYYTRPDDYERAFMYDGYGRLAIGPKFKSKGFPAYQQLAHRVLFQVGGGVLKPGWEINHECGFHPCGNPGHFTQMTREENIAHMLSMRDARRKKTVRGAVELLTIEVGV